MQVLKIFLIGLLLLVSISQILNNPGVGNLSLFNTYLKSESANPNFNIIDLFSKYPPGIYFVFSNLLTLFPPNANIYFFYQQTSWIISKFLIFFFYLFTCVALIYLNRTIKTSKLSSLDVALIFFASVSVLLMSVSLSYFSIFAVPFTILAVTFLFKEQFVNAAFFYFLSLSFDFSLLVLFPIFLIYYRRQHVISKYSKVVSYTLFLITPLTILGTYLINAYFNNFKNLYTISATQIFGIPWLIKQPFVYFVKIPPGKIDFLGVVTIGVVVLISVFVLSYLVKNFFLKFIVNKKIFTLSSLLISIFIFFVTPLFIINSIVFVHIFVFLVFYLLLLLGFKKIAKLTPQIFIVSCFCIYLVFVLFFPGISEGTLIWPVLLSLVFLILKDSQIARLQLLTVNIIVFINLFVIFGTAGIISVRGGYFNFFQTIFASANVIFFAKYIYFWYKRRFKLNDATNDLDSVAVWLKRFLVVYIFLIIFSLIPANGTGDVVSYNDTANVSVQHINLFEAYIIDKEMYPPLSTGIISFFANSWKMIVGASESYHTSNKLSVLFFYLLTVWVFLNLKVSKLEKIKFATLDKLIVILTTFSLIIQTEGLADVNIYLIPSLIASIVVLYKQKYFFSGFLLGVTLTIKWQPLIILPLFLVTLFNFQQSLQTSFRRIIFFLGGLVVTPLIIWYFVLSLPQGYAAFYRSMDYMFNFTGFHLLSGQALNLNWIVTYFLHIFQPVTFHSIEYFDGLNWQIPSDYAPAIFRGFFFYLASLVIFLRYLLSKKKDILNFVSSCLMIFFSHHILNSSAHEKHLFYTVIFMLFLYLIRPTKSNRQLLILFDVMTVINLIFFYGFTGPKDINRLFFGFDLTIAFALYYVIIYLWVLKKFLQGRLFVSDQSL